MDINIQVLSTTQTAKQNAKGGTYQELEVAYKDLTNGGKVASRKVMDFAAKEAFQTLVLAKPGEVYDISMIKKGDYWNWTAAKKGVASSSTTSAAQPRGSVGTGGAAPAVKGGWETPEERKARQIYIVRQSSLTNAISTLSLGRKGELNPTEVIELAQRYEAFVFASTESIANQARDDGTIESLESDIPF